MVFQTGIYKVRFVAEKDPSDGHLKEKMEREVADVGCQRKEMSRREMMTR